MLLTALLAAGIAGAVHAVQGGSPAGAFADGVAAYRARDYAAARAAFARAVALEPRAADAWVNFGTAAWAMRDTVGAVAGWRHGLGLQPMAGDARNRLTLVHGVRALSPGYVPPVSVNALLFLVALCWLAACVAWHPAARRHAPRLAAGRCRWPSRRRFSRWRRWPSADGCRRAGPPSCAPTRRCGPIPRSAPIRVPRSSPARSCAC